MNYTLPLFGNSLGTIQANSTGAASQNGIVALFDTQGNLNPVGSSQSNLTLAAMLVLGRHATLTANTTLDESAIVWPCDATSAAFTATLPAAGGRTGKIYVIKRLNSGGNAVTVQGNAAETIDGSNTYSLSAQYSTIIIQSNGTGWDILAKF